MNSPNFQEFINKYCKLSPSAMAPKSNLYSEYEFSYRRGKGVSITHEEFDDLVKQLPGVTEGYMCWIGIGRKEPWENLSMVEQALTIVRDRIIALEGTPAAITLLAEMNMIVYEAIQESARNVMESICTCTNSDGE